MKVKAPFGSWSSPITAEFVAGKDPNLTADMQVDGGILYFVEARPNEGGRRVLLAKAPGEDVREVLPTQFNVRTRYLEYGAKSFVVHRGTVYFVNYADQQVYACAANADPYSVTQDSNSRFADLVVDERRGRLLALRERLEKPESVNSICEIVIAGGSVRDLVGGRDFFNAPRLSPSGDQILWVSWNHPNMAWNGTELWIAPVDAEGTIGAAQKIAGDANHGVCQPQWTSENEICFTGELEEWFNLYRYRAGRTINCFPKNAEFAYPDWTPGQKRYAAGDGNILAAFVSKGESRLIWLRDDQQEVLPISFANISSIEASENGFYLVASFADQSAAILHWQPESREFQEVYRSYTLAIAKEEIALPKAIDYPSTDGTTAHAWFYEPCNAKFTGLDGEKPPLIVMCHGGPTDMSTGEFKKSIQFWTNRGYAVVDVNYGGSAGYGRAYRERLRGTWGVVDVHDATSAVQYLAREGKIDPQRVAIRGGSAGGYTTLAALTFTQGIIAVGASYFGVSDPELLAQETHKLESRYLDQLIGPYPEAKAVYQERSPLAHVKNLNCPIIFFQGDEDKVVLPNQSELMFQSLKAKGIRTEYHLYSGEGHGFVRAETVQHSLKAEHGFYAKQFAYTVAAQDKV